MARPDNIISDETAKNFIEVLNDPERARNFTPKQIGQIQTSLKEYIEFQEKRSQGLQAQGLTPAQAAEVSLQEDLASESDSMGTFGAGGIDRRARLLARGGSSALEGVIQLGEGLVDLGLEAGAFFNIEGARELADDHKREAGDRRFREKLADIERYGETNPFLAEVGLSALALAPATSVRIASLPKYVLYNGMIGGTLAAGMLSDKTLDERLGDATFGLVGGGALSILGAPSWGKYYAARTYMRQFNASMAKKNEALEQEIRGLLWDEDFGFSMAQMTGSRFLHRLEQGAGARIAKEQQNKNINAIWKHLIQRSREMRRGASPGSGGAVRPGADAGTIAKELRATLAQANKAIHDRASGNFALALDGILEEFSDSLIITRGNAQEYLFKVQKIIDENSGKFAPGSNVSPAFRKYMNTLDETINPAVVEPMPKVKDQPQLWLIRNRRTGEILYEGIPEQRMAQVKALQFNETRGGFDALETTEIIKGVNGLMKGRFKVLDSADDASTNRQMGKALYGTLMESIDMDGNNKLAVDALNEMRLAYRGEMLRIQHMEDLAINSVFGQKLAAADPDSALDKVLAGGKTAMRDTRDFLEDWNPALLDELRATLLRRAAERSRVPAAPGVDTTVDLAKLANEIAGPKGIGQLGKGLFDNQTQGELVRLGKALTVIQNHYFKGISAPMVSVDDLAINIISRSPEFMGRFLTRALTSGRSMEQALYDPVTRRAIIALAEEGPTTKAGKAAVLALVRFVAGRAKAEEDDKNARIHAETVRALERRGLQ